MPNTFAAEIDGKIVATRTTHRSQPYRFAVMVNGPRGWYAESWTSRLEYARKPTYGNRVDTSSHRVVSVRLLTPEEARAHSNAARKARDADPVLAQDRIRAASHDFVRQAYWLQRYARGELELRPFQSLDRLQAELDRTGRRLAKHCRDLHNLLTAGR